MGIDWWNIGRIMKKGSQGSRIVVFGLQKRCTIFKPLHETCLVLLLIYFFIAILGLTWDVKKKT